MWCELFVLPRPKGDFGGTDRRLKTAARGWEMAGILEGIRMLMERLDSDSRSVDGRAGAFKERGLWAARVGGWAARCRGGVGIFGMSGAHPGAQIRASRRASAPTRRAARARGGGGWDRRLVQLSNDCLGAPPFSFLASAGIPLARRDANRRARARAPGPQIIWMAPGSSLALQRLPRATLSAGSAFRTAPHHSWRYDVVRKNTHHKAVSSGSNRTALRWLVQRRRWVLFSHFYAL
eukprot:gene4849-biopygen17551